MSEVPPPPADPPAEAVPPPPNDAYPGERSTDSQLSPPARSRWQKAGKKAILANLVMQAPPPPPADAPGGPADRAISPSRSKWRNQVSATHSQPTNENVTASQPTYEAPERASVQEVREKQPVTTQLERLKRLELEEVNSQEQPQHQGGDDGHASEYDGHGESNQPELFKMMLLRAEVEEVGGEDAHEQLAMIDAHMSNVRDPSTPLRMDGRVSSSYYSPNGKKGTAASELGQAAKDAHRRVKVSITLHSLCIPGPKTLGYSAVEPPARVITSISSGAFLNHTKVCSYNVLLPSGYSRETTVVEFALTE